MRILFVYPYITFPDLIPDTLPVYMARRGHRVDVLTYVRNSNEKKAYSHIEKEHLHFHFANALNMIVPRLVTMFPYFLSLESLVEKYRPDVIHANNLPFLTTSQSMKVAKKLGKAGIVHVHGVIGQNGPIIDNAQRAYIRAVGNNVFGNASRVICLTNQDAKELYRFGCPIEKTRIVPNGVNLDSFRREGDEIQDSIVWGGRFVPQKGLEYLIRALAIIVERHKRIRLVMFGDGPLLPKIFHMVKEYGLAENSTFKGRVTRSAIPQILNMAEVYVLPSLKEGMPFALLEAMACSKAVVASDIPGINDVITDGSNGILVPPRDPVTLANAILRLTQDQQLRHRIGRSARRLMVEKYDWNVIAKRVEDIYYEAIEDSK